MNPTTELQGYTVPLNRVRLAGGIMACAKCGVGYMIDDSCNEIEVYKCWVCGDRIYAGYPKRWGALVCSRCGKEKHEENELGYCEDCLRLLNIHIDRTKRRSVARPSAGGVSSPEKAAFIPLAARQ
jgi:hypothetical protein